MQTNTTARRRSTRLIESQSISEANKDQKLIEYYSKRKSQLIRSLIGLSLCFIFICALAIPATTADVNQQAADKIIKREESTPLSFKD